MTLDMLRVGNEALELCRKHPHDYVLYFPIKYGILNFEVNKHYVIDEHTILDIIVYMMNKCIRDIMSTRNETSFNLLIIMSDTLINHYWSHVKTIVNEILVQNTNISHLSIQRESIMSYYGCGISHNQTELITIDMGLTKTSIYSYNTQGRIQSNLILPYGGYDIYNLINGILQMSKFNHSIDIGMNLNEYDNNVRKYYMTLKTSAHQETFQHLQNILIDEGQLAKTMTISSDVFYIATHMYFNTKLLPSPKKKIYQSLNHLSSTSKITSIDKYLLKSIKSSGSTTICLIGGFSNIQHYPEYLKEILKKKRIKILMGNERDKLVPTYALSWKGGVIMTHLLAPMSTQDSESVSSSKDQSNTSMEDSSEQGHLKSRLFTTRSEVFSSHFKALHDRII